MKNNVNLVTERASTVITSSEYRYYGYVSGIRIKCAGRVLTTALFLSNGFFGRIRHGKLESHYYCGIRCV